MRRIAAWLVVLGVGVATASAQQPAAVKKSFDVASIKAAPPLDPVKMLNGQQRVGMKMDAGRVDIENWSVLELLNAAFKVGPTRMAGPAAPGMANMLTLPRYDIHATLPAGATKDDVPELLQSLLVERWKLDYHFDKREQNVFALVVGKDGPKLEKSPEEAAPDPSAPATNRPDALQVSGNPQSGTMTIRGAGQAGTLKIGRTPEGNISLQAERLTMAQLADSLVQFVGRPVVDQTGLAGNYQVAFEMTQEDLLNVARQVGLNVPGAPGGGPAAGPADPSGGTTAFRSVEKMGLKLEPKKAAVDTLVIEKLEKAPTED